MVDPQLKVSKHLAEVVADAAQWSAADRAEWFATLADVYHVSAARIEMAADGAAGAIPACVAARMISDGEL